MDKTTTATVLIRVGLKTSSGLMTNIQPSPLDLACEDYVGAYISTTTCGRPKGFHDTMESTFYSAWVDMLSSCYRSRRKPTTQLMFITEVCAATKRSAGRVQCKGMAQNELWYTSPLGTLQIWVRFAEGVGFALMV